MDLDSRQRDNKLLQIKNEAERQKARQLLQQSLHTDDGWLLRVIEKVDHFSSDKLSILHWLTKWKPQWHGSVSVVEKLCGGMAAAGIDSFFLIDNISHSCGSNSTGSICLNSSDLPLVQYRHPIGFIPMS